MIEEAYCSFEVSKLLKERGFDEYCRYFYDCETPTNGYLSNKGYGEYIHNSKVYDGRNLAACPTHQMAMAWLREVHGVFIAINNDDLDFNWQCYDLINRGSTLDPKILSESYAGYKTYEKAVEAALKYCLENLI